MPRQEGLGARLWIATLCTWVFGPAAAQSQSDFSAAAAYFDDPDLYNVLSCNGPVQSGPCQDETFCEVKLVMLKLVIRGMDSNLPSMMLSMSRQAMGDYLGDEANAACFDANTASNPDLIPNMRLIASGTEDGLTVAGYGAAEMAQQVFFPLQALGNNSAAECFEGFTGHFTQRPQVTFYID